ncbi:adenylate/guanylate cyclase domain-containing protein [Mucilaginibacter ginkgonis]
MYSVAKKFRLLIIYDLWVDTVNTAARMEQIANPEKSMYQKTRTN